MNLSASDDVRGIRCDCLIMRLAPDRWNVSDGICEHGRSGEYDGGGNEDVLLRSYLVPTEFRGYRV